MPLGASRITLLARSATVTAVAEVIRAKKSVIAIGNAQIDTAQSKFGGSSLLLDGTDNLVVSPMQATTGDATIEYWVRFTTAPAAKASTSWQAAWCKNASVYAIMWNNYLQLGVQTASSGLHSYGSFAYGSTLTTGTWYHIAIVRSSGDYKVYFNGVDCGAAVDDARWSTRDGAFDMFGEATNIIGSYTTNAKGIIGNMDEFRVSNIARYTANFTPSTTPFVNDANTLLLLHCDGTDASTYFEDDNGVRAQKGIFALGNAQVDTAQSKFGGSSLLLDGTGDGLLVNSTSDMIWGSSSNFTYEGWFRWNSTTSTYMFDQRTAFGTFAPCLLFETPNINYYVGGTARISYNWTPTTGVWYHFALVRNNGTTTLYKDGVSVGSFSDSLTYVQGNSNLYVGAWYSSAGNGHNGWIDDFRVSNIARYTANFTPSTTPFVNDTNTICLIHGNGTDASTVFIDDNGTGRSSKGIQAIGNAQVDTAQSKFGGSSALFDGTGDYLKVYPATDFNFSGDWTIEFWRYLSTNTVTYPGVISTGVNGTKNGFTIFSYPTTNALGYIQSADGGTSGINVYGYTGSIATGSWHHIAFVRNGNTIKAYVNGTASGTTGTVTAGPGSISTTDPLYIGTGLGISSGLFSGGNQDFNGWLDEIRISNIARYTANFTAPTAPFQNDDNTLLLIHANGTDASTVFTDDNGVTPNWSY